MSGEGVLSLPGRCTHTTANGVGSPPLRRSETKKRHKYRTFGQGIFKKQPQKQWPLSILQPTTFGSFQRKQLSPPQAIRESKIPLSYAPVETVKEGRRTNGGQEKAEEADIPTPTAPTSLGVCLPAGNPCLEPLLGEQVSYQGGPAAGDK